MAVARSKVRRNVSQYFVRAAMRQVGTLLAKRSIRVTNEEDTESDSQVRNVYYHRTQGLYRTG